MIPNIVIPMAGRGTRFSDKGFNLPKPLIEVADHKPMIRVVVENLGFRGRYTFFCLGEHLDGQPLASVLNLVCEGRGLGKPTIVRSDEVTQGQADSVRRCLENDGPIPSCDHPLIVANCDQFLDAWHPGAFLEYVERTKVDGAILTFNGTDPKWSFAKVADETNTVIATAEKTPISKRATVGVYYFRTAQIALDGIKKMMSDDSKRVNGEFYLCPVYNTLIEDGYHIIEYPVVAMHGLGTPEDLAEFQRLHAAGRLRV